MTDAVRAQLAAAGVKVTDGPHAPKRSKKPATFPPVNATPPAELSRPADTSALHQRPENAQAEPRARPAYGYTQWPGTTLWRFAAHDLSPAQLACLEAAAAQCGIRNANPQTP
jgi:hypothetical protein